ncbi:MAG TPA: SDR family NAD(P)-dependent oxidoreductase [Acidimicrobiales bacterium]|nr:SDR family NAD(P)-dependent oxidoreductase [Acidimicrobiales bacterium]
MESLEGKVAVVTGGASGIGLGLARRFLADGALVTIADVEDAALGEAAAALSDEHGGDRVLAVRTDVRDPEAVEALAEATFERFGTAHVVCNNAGVGVGGLTWTIPADRWRWIVEVNLLGVANGIRSFVPRLIEQGEGHVVNTASSAGILTGPGMSPYFATKHAVVALSESLYFDLQYVDGGDGVGVSVLCPEWVRTRIADSERNRPEDVSAMVLPESAPDEVAPVVEPVGVPVGGEGAGAGDPADAGGGDPVDAGALGGPGDGGGEVLDPRTIIQALIERGIEPAEVADQVADAIRNGRFWILTHETTLPLARKRWDAMASGGHPTFWDVTVEGA